MPTTSLPAEDMERLPHAAAGAPAGWRLMAWATVFYLAQMGGAELGMALTVPGSHISLLWLPAGIAVAGWMRLGWIALPVVWLAAYTVQLRLGLSPLTAMGFALGDTLGAWLTVTLLQHARLRAVMDSQREVFGFLLASGIGAALAAAFGMLALAATGRVPPAGLASAGLWWWMGDWAGCVVAGPLLVLLTRQLASWWRARWATICVTVALIALASLFAFSAWSPVAPGARLMAYLPIPFLILAALRSGPLGTSLSATLVSLAAAWGTVTGHGPFVDAAGGTGMTEGLSLWAYILTTSAAATILCALQVQRRRAERDANATRELLDAIRQAQSAFIAGQDTPVVFDGLLSALLRLSGSEFGFIGEVRRDEDEAPYLRTFALTDISWDEASRAMLHEHLSAGMEFRRLDTLFGAVMVNEAPVIANDAANDPRAGGLPQGHPPLHRFLGVPFFADGEMVGMVGVANRPDDYGVAMVEALAPFLDTCATLTVALQSRAARLAADEQMRENEARYRHLFERNPNMMCVYDRETLAFLDVNEAMLAHYGYTRDDMLAMSMCDIRPPQDVAEFLAKQRRYADVDNVSDSARHCLKDGTVIEVEGQVNRIVYAGRHANMVAIRDVTRQRRAERDLVASEASHRQMFLKNPYPMWVFDLENLRFLDVNDAAVAHYGYSREEFLAMTIEQIRPREEVAQLHAKLAEGVRDLRVRDRARHITRDGRLIEVEGSVHSIVYQGRPARLALAMDITDRVAAERALRESEARLDLAVHGVGDGVWDWDLDSGTMTCSAACERMLGYEPGDIAPTQAGWDAITHPQDLPVVEASVQAALQGRSDMLDVEFRVRASDGSWRWIRERGKVLERHPDGRPRRIVGTQTDVTAHKEAEASRLALLAQLSEVANHVPGAIYEFVQDPQGRMRFSYVSDRVRDLIGLSPKEVQDDLGAAMSMVVPEDRARLMGSIRASAQGLGMWRAEFRVRRPDGQMRWLRASSTPQRRPDGHIVWHGYMQDVTDLHALEQALQDRSAAQSANRAKTAFLSRMSHELRTPLNAVLGFAQLLDLDRSEPLTSEQRRRVGHIREAGQHLLDMIVELLDLTRIESGQLQFRIDAVPLRPLLREVVALFEPEAAQSDVRIRLEIAGDVPDRLGTDPTRLRQILANLVGNAVKYNRPQGWVEVDVRVAGGAEGEPGLRITVEDGGMGMSEEQLGRLFEPFNRLGRERSAVSGSGIGLALTKALIELLGGTIEVRSRLDQGSAFTVWLPELWPDTTPGALDDEAG